MHRTTTLTNGLTVHLDTLPEVRSAAVALLVPGGIAHDPEDAVGLSLVLSELSGRGAGRFPERMLAETLDAHGITHERSSGLSTALYSATFLPEHLSTALEILAAVAFAPHLPEDQLDAARQLFLHDLDGLEEDPARRLMLELSRLLLEEPYCRPSVGSAEGLLGCTHAGIVAASALRRGSAGCVLSVAGSVEHESALAEIERCFGSLAGKSLEIPRFPGFKQPQHRHLPEETEQLHLGIALPSAGATSPLLYAAKVAAEILSGSMSGRLFMELREKRGLCYEVSLQHQGGLQYGIMSAYCATAEKRAAAALELLIAELERLPRDVTESELQQARTNLEASIILSEEGPLDRAKANAFDLLLLGRVRPLEELQLAIQSVTIDDLRALWAEYPLDSRVVVALGSRLPWGDAHDR